MTLLKDIEYANKKLNECADNLPSKLEKMEARIYERLVKSKRVNLYKLKELYSLMDKLSAHIFNFTTCKNTCSSCCYIRVDLSEVEIQHIENTYKIKRNKQIKPSTDGSGSPCCFLVDNSCSIYEGRPFMCRRHYFFTPDNKWCDYEKNINNKEEFPLLRFTEVDKSYFHVISKNNNIYDIREVFGKQK